MYTIGLSGRSSRFATLIAVVLLPMSNFGNAAEPDPVHDLPVKKIVMLNTGVAWNTREWSTATRRRPCSSTLTM